MPRYFPRIGWKLVDRFDLGRLDRLVQESTGAAVTERVVLPNIRYVEGNKS
jgi:hypothetical protein